MALIDNMIALNARLTAIPIRFGVPQYRPLLIRHVTLDATATEPTTTDTLITPQPMVQNVTPNLVGLQFGDSSVEIRNDDYSVTGIPRTYTREFLTNDVEFYAILESETVTYDDRGMPINAELCKCLHVGDRELLTWNLTLRKLKDNHDNSESAGLF